MKTGPTITKPPRQQVTCALGQGLIRCSWIDPGMHPAGRRYCVMGDYVIVYLMRGSAIVTDDQDQTFTFSQGDLFFRPPGIPHFVLRPQPRQWLSFALGISTEIYQSLKPLQILPQRLKIWHVGKGDVYTRKCQRLTQTVRQGQQLSPQTLLHRIMAWLDEMTHVKQVMQADASIPRKIRQAASMLTESYDGDVDLQQIAEKIDMGYEHFRKAFTHHMGKSPMAYRITHRIGHAQSRLLETEVSVSALAEQLGYADVYTFSRQFKQFTGQSPTAFRNQSMPQGL
ncbi:MAG TPA: hypothetical protein DCM28_22595 [Phycisphaerales bacterium]|nr:hypothetical protein [Phycisphaerales bacterium]HCD33032.1 hypothetical protein [Phycisphaerales bacterium]|tara:strand:- start:659 stop:1510 length:852 start_codon:yes stop_codon:yes gene_type:complete